MDSKLRYEYLVSQPDPFIDTIKEALPVNITTDKSYAYILRDYLLLCVKMEPGDGAMALHERMEPLGYNTYRGTINYHHRFPLQEYEYAIWDKDRRLLITDKLYNNEYIYVIVARQGLLHALKLDQ